MDVSSSSSGSLQRLFWKFVESVSRGSSRSFQRIVSGSFKRFSEALCTFLGVHLDTFILPFRRISSEHLHRFLRTFIEVSLDLSWMIPLDISIGINKFF